MIGRELPRGGEGTTVGASAVLAVFASAFAVFCINLNHGFTVDEYTTWTRLGMPLSEMVRDRVVNGHMPTYFILLKAWASVFGDSRIAMRLPSVIMAAGGVAALYYLGAYLWGRGPGLVIAGTSMFHQVIVWCAQNARPWAGIFLLTGLLAVMIVLYADTGRRRFAVVAAAVVLVGVSFGAAFVMGVLGMAVGLAAWRRVPATRRLSGIAAMLSPLLLLALPAALFALRQEKMSLGQEGFAFYPGRAVNSLANVLLGDSDNWARDWARYAALLVFVLLAGAFAGESRRLGGERRAGAGIGVFLGYWFVVPWALLVLAAALSGVSILPHERYYVPMLGALIVMGSLGAGWWASQVRFGVLVPVLAALLLLRSTVQYWSSDGDGPKQLARKLEEAGPVTAIAGTVVPMQYEFRHRSDIRWLGLYPGSIAGQSNEWEEFVRENGQAWLVVYDNQGNRLHSLQRHPGPGLRVVKRLEAGYARAILVEAGERAQPE